MIMQETKELVSRAIDVEIKNALAQGKLVDKHHIYAILKEEVEEADREFERIKQNLSSFWILATKGGKDSQATVLEEMKNFAKDAMCELAQVCAVCEKAQMQVYEKDGNNGQDKQI